VPSVALVYQHLVNIKPATKGQITRFHAVKPPDISISHYLERIRRYFGCSNECFVLSLVYIDRIVKLHEDFSISILNIHRLLVTSVMLAAKFFDDVYYSNAFYARVGGVRTREINILEAHFLSLLDFHLFVTPQEYDQYRNNVLTAISLPHNRTLRPAVEESQQSSSASSRPPSNASTVPNATPRASIQSNGTRHMAPATFRENDSSYFVPPTAEVVSRSAENLQQTDVGVSSMPTVSSVQHMKGPPCGGSSTCPSTTSTAVPTSGFSSRASMDFNCSTANSTNAHYSGEDWYNHRCRGQHSTMYSSGNSVKSANSVGNQTPSGSHSMEQPPVFQMPNYKCDTPIYTNSSTTDPLNGLPYTAHQPQSTGGYKDNRTYFEGFAGGGHSKRVVSQLGYDPSTTACQRIPNSTSDYVGSVVDPYTHPPGACHPSQRAVLNRNTNASSNVHKRTSPNPSCAPDGALVAVSL